MLELIQKLYASGEVIVSVFLLRQELGADVTKEGMLDRYLYLDRSPWKAHMFDVLKRAMAEYEESTRRE